MKRIISIVLIAMLAVLVYGKPIRNALGAKGGEKGIQPPYDAEAEYLETDGNAYVSTGIVPSKNAIVEVRGQFGYASASSGRRFLIGDGNQNVAHYCEFNAKNEYGGGSVYTSPTLTGNALYRASMTIMGATRAAYGIEVSGTTYTTGTSEFASGVFGGLSLFRLNQNYRGSGQRIARCEIYVNATLVRDFIPVRFTNELGQSEGAMYDRVSGQLFRNQGSGSFVIDPDKN